MRKRNTLLENQRFMRRKFRRSFGRHRRKSSVFIILLAIAGILLIGRGGYIYAKAELAQYLIHTSWKQSLISNKEIKPWPWADTWPVARMMAPKYKVDLVVLSGDSGRTLAFGPGHRFGTTAPGDNGNSIVSAHRDTHFKFLQYLNIGDELVVQNHNAQIQYFQVVDTKVVDADKVSIPVDYSEPVLTLVTCYPFNKSTPGGSLRYLVTLVEIKDKELITT